MQKLDSNINSFPQCNKRCLSSGKDDNDVDTTFKKPRLDVPDSLAKDVGVHPRPDDTGCQGESGPYGVVVSKAKGVVRPPQAVRCFRGGPSARWAACGRLITP
jgi:hypothetical protein